MQMSVREARARFAHALSVAESGERVTITKNGKAVAEIGPPAPVSEGEEKESFWDKLMRVRKEMGLGDPVESRTDEESVDDFDGPEWRKIWDDYRPLQNR